MPVAVSRKIEYFVRTLGLDLDVRMFPVVLTQEQVQYYELPRTLAFFWQKSRFGTTGEAHITRSLGNERCVANRPYIDRDRGGYAVMQRWFRPLVSAHLVRLCTWAGDDIYGWTCVYDR